MQPLRTNRLLLVPVTAEAISLEMGQHDRLAKLLGCHVPQSWPPGNVRDVLEMFESILRERPDEIGWHAWYWIAIDQPDGPTLVGSGGFRGPPQNGQVEVGYGTLEIFHRRGYATEAVRALCDYAFSDPRVSEIIAECDSTNVASQRVLAKCAFTQVDPLAERDVCRYRRHRVE